MAARIGERIREFRKSLGLTQAELAELSAVDDMTISRLETGVRAPSLDQLERLATVFSIPVSQFFDDSEDQLLGKGTMLAAMLSELNAEQQKFVMKFVRSYIETHGEKAKT